ncbi:ATP-binding protein [Streptomyces sp. NPDC092296]|uniref:ATP-binding protein n=1 Tax=Streptomyces sp. NPDC092296 TaxID=3366012 RepID=UPI0037FBC39E
MPPSRASRPQAVRLPKGRTLLALPLSALVTGAACLWAVLAAPEAARTAVTATGVTAAVLLTAAVTVAARALGTVRGARARSEQLARDTTRLGADLTRAESETRRLRDRVAEQEAEAERLREETARLAAQAGMLADELLPGLVKRLRAGSSADTALTELPEPADAVHRRVLETVAHELAAGERMRAATMSACANAASRVQALATTMLADLRTMEERHGEEVLGDLLKLDHATAQAGRLADSIAVLTGARSGRRWTKPIVMESILRGAMGRISAYQRVRWHSTCSVAVAGHAAEGVMHALAELMDNATSFSPPTEEVHVYVEEVAAGVVVTIEDGGLVMNPEKLSRAQRAVSTEPLDFATLSSTRLGLAVVGCLARKHRLTVSFRPSSRGGTGAVVLIPRELITQPRQGMATPAADRPRATGRPRPRTAAPAGRTAAAPKAVRTTEPVRAGEPTESTRAAESAPAALPAQSASSPAAGTAEVHGLPKRPRGQTLAASEARVEEAPQPQPQAPRTGSGARFRAFRQAVRGGTPSSAPKDAPQDTLKGAPNGDPESSTPERTPADGDQ